MCIYIHENNQHQVLTLTLSICFMMETGSVPTGSFSSTPSFFSASPHHPLNPPTAELYCSCLLTRSRRRSPSSLDVVFRVSILSLMVEMQFRITSGRGFSWKLRVKVRGSTVFRKSVRVSLYACFFTEEEVRGVNMGSII